MKKYKFSILTIVLIGAFCVGIGFVLNAILDNRTEVYNNLLLNIDTMQAKINILEEKVAKIEKGDTLEQEEINLQTKEAATESVAAASWGEIVYKTKSGNKYHKKDCEALNDSAVAISMEEAKATGLQPCKKCFK